MKKIEISIGSLVKAIIVIIIGLLLLMQTPTFATTGKSTSAAVRIRQTPTTETDDNVIGTLAVDDVVEILGQEGDWYKIKFEGTIGYVSKAFISTNDKDNIQTSNEQSTEIKNDEEVNNNPDEITENVDNSNVSGNVEDNNETNTQTTSVTKVYKMADDSKMRILPIVTAEEIGNVKKDENVSLVINAGLWAYIKTSNVSGWVRIDKISAEDVVVSDNKDNENKDENAKSDEKEENPTTPEDNKQSQTVTIEPKKMYANSAAINVRSEANTTSDVVDSIGLNTEVTAVGEENGWYKVQVNGSTGFIRKDLLSAEKTEVTSRNNELDRSAAAQNNAQTSTNNQQAQVAEQPAASSTSVPVSSSGVSGNDIAEYARQFVGCSYVYGASGPSSFDCSGLTMYVYQHFGYSLSHSSKVQATQGVPVSGELQPGDILVFSNDGKQVGHVGIYIGNDKFVHASDSSTGVIISNLHDRWNINKYWGARRIIQ